MVSITYGDHQDVLASLARLLEMPVSKTVICGWQIAGDGLFGFAEPLSRTSNARLRKVKTD